MILPDCLFCRPEDPMNRVIEQNELAYARWDDNPANEGHALILPKKHIEQFSCLETSEVVAMHALAKVVYGVIVEKYKPDGFTIGVDDGKFAGQIFPHTTMNIIPRYFGDVDNPRGGVRWIIPATADYLAQ